MLIYCDMRERPSLAVLDCKIRRILKSMRKHHDVSLTAVRSQIVA